MITKNNKKKIDNNQIFYKNKPYNKKKPYNIFNYLKKKKKIRKPKITNYLHINKKLKKGIFFKVPTFNEIKYPIPFNLKLINEYLKKN